KIGVKIMYFIKKNSEEKKNNLVDDFQNFFMDSFFSNKALKTDIVETEKSYILKVDLPGVEKKDINLDFNNQYLTLSVNQEEDKEDREQHYIRKERSRFSYSRSYYLDKADETTIKAKLDNGILTITIGKNEEDIKKTITID
ncbi:MAG: Hsp20/alpha crystallin family protein, partial [Anaeroplasmataceae bacterium]|nr:Hsp20/alpha crystallin family protein [Anaeroplasmataceae bacterium]